jgi:hypothetical protein
MALQIRRGTEAQRGSLSGLNTPAVGEPLYTTDTKKLFIGDGSTTGGVALGYYSAINVAGQSSLSAANNTDTLTLVAGTNVVLTTDAGTDTITISAPRDVEVFNTGSINIFQNNIQGLNSNENIIIDPSGTGKVVVNGEVESTSLQTNRISMGTYSDTPSQTYFQSEGPDVTRSFRTGGPGALTTAEFHGYHATPANGQEGFKLIFRQSTGNSTNDFVGFISTVVTDVSAGNVDSEYNFTVRNNNSLTVSGAIDGSGFRGNLTGNVTGNVTGDINGSIFADDSTLLVDAINNIHAGSFTTGELNIVDHTISTLNSNQDLIIDLAGTGRLDVQATIQASRLEMFNDVFTGGIALTSAASTNASLVIATTHNSASTSPAFVTNIETFRGPQVGATVTFLRSKGANPLAPQSVANNDEISTFDFNGFYLPDSAFYSAAKIRGVVDGAPSAGAVPGRLEFVASNSSGSSAVRLTVSSTAVTATVPFKLPVVADDTARTALVATPAQGMMIFMQSGTSPTATNVAQVYDGTAWVNL